MIENKTVDSSFRICIHLTTGETREHLYPNSTVQDIKEVQAAMNLISNSFTKRAWNLKVFQNDISQILPLQYPDTIYNPSHILFIEHGPYKKAKL